MIARLLKKPIQIPKSFFLLGPRGTGKTWWVKENFPHALYFDLLKSELYYELLAHPGKIENLIPDNFNDWIVIDEIQRIPALLNEVHRLIEAKQYKFVLTGSSARKLRKNGVNLLAGRALIYHMHPLSVQELGDQFNLSRSLEYGHLPALLNEPDPQAYLNAYVKTYLREEVLQEGLTRNISAFARFLEVASFSQGCILTLSAIAREVAIHQKVIANYFEILEDLLIASRLPVFTKRAKRKTVNHPKFYLFDVGVYRAIRPKGYLDSTMEIEGISLETLFLQELQVLNDYLQLEYEFYYWRTQTGIEVDFIAYGPKGLIAFEIKRSARATTFDTKSLCAFKEEYPEAKLYLVYGGQEKYYFDNVTAIPFEIALKELSTLLSE